MTIIPDMDPLPTYGATRAPGFTTTGTAPPSYTFPTTFPIGRQRAAPLINSIQLKGHLTLLGAFAALHAQIEALDSASSVNIQLLVPEDKDKRWTWFVGLAVERQVIIYLLD